MLDLFQLFNEKNWSLEEQEKCLYTLSNHVEQHYRKVWIPKRNGKKGNFLFQILFFWKFREKYCMIFCWTYRYQIMRGLIERDMDCARWQKHIKEKIWLCVWISENFLETLLTA